MQTIELRCLLCGKVYVISEEDRDYKKISQAQTTTSYICDLCNNRVRYEADEQRKPKKPISS
jgi:uncharacterized protein YlaI